LAPTPRHPEINRLCVFQGRLGNRPWVVSRFSR
jgi:hypothetical protein